jgi:hypothetical protein
LVPAIGRWSKARDGACLVRVVWYDSAVGLGVSLPSSSFKQAAFKGRLFLLRQVIGYSLM